MKTQNKGFTLIELLVVISIIAVLLSILMPSLNEAKRQTASVICRSNLKHWGLVTALYQEDHDGKMCSSGYGMDTYVANGGVIQDYEDTLGRSQWMNALRPYYENPDFRVCPSAKKPMIPPPGGSYAAGVGSTRRSWGMFDGVSDWWLLPGDYGSYGINIWFNHPHIVTSGFTYGSRDVSWFWTNNVPRPARVPVFLDCADLNGGPRTGDDAPQWPDDGVDEANMKPFCLDRHKGAINVLFADMRARKVGLKELWTLKWSKGYDTRAPLPVWPEWMRKFKEP